MGVGYVVRNTNTQEMLDRGHRTISGRGTNNVSEYTAVLTACNVAKKLKPKRLSAMQGSTLKMVSSMPITVKHSILKY